jgi:hypothetical protein
MKNRIQNIELPLQNRPDNILLVLSSSPDRNNYKGNNKHSHAHQTHTRIQSK